MANGVCETQECRLLFEEVLGNISSELITNGVVTPDTIYASQKTIRDGVITVGLNENERQLVFESNIASAMDDESGTPTYDSQTTFPTGSVFTLGGIIEHCITTQGTSGSAQIQLSSLSELIGGGDVGGDWGTSVYLKCGTTEFNIQDLIANGATGNPYNVGQFTPVVQTSTLVNQDQAAEFLDTYIYELLPQQRTRQERIDALFKEIEELKGPSPDTAPFAWVIDPTSGNIDPPSDYMAWHDISFTQEPSYSTFPQIDEEESYITRLDINANDANQGKTIQSLRDSLSEYLKDIDQVIDAEIEDERPEYNEKSDGYIKIRNLNQAIIVRKQEGDEIGIEQNITMGFTDGLQGHHSHAPLSDGADPITAPSYLMDGFTTTMWVKFLDKTARGTLFNYGNPFRAKDPKGFRLETYVLGRDDELLTQSGVTWGQIALEAGHDGTDPTHLFYETDYERFVRLVVYDHIPHATGDEPFRRLYDSSLGMLGFPKNFHSVPEFGMTGGLEDDSRDWQEGDEVGLLTHTRIPINLDEWYFIVATFDPAVNDIQVNSSYVDDPNYWKGNILYESLEDIPEYIHYSGYGNKAKVEILSKTDLLRARGYKV